MRFTQKKKKGKQHMDNMKFNDDNQPVYSDEGENLIFRVKDIKKLIEDKTQLPVTRLVSMGSQSNPETQRELHPDLMPKRIWFVLATFQTPEGVKTSEVFVMLKDGQLSLPYRVFLHLETFLYSNREQAKENIPDLTLDYIQTLEVMVSHTWRMWRDLSYYLHRHHDDPAAQAVNGVIKHQMDELYKELQNVGFLNMSNEKQDPFPTGF